MLILDRPPSSFVDRYDAAHTCAITQCARQHRSVCRPASYPLTPAASRTSISYGCCLSVVGVDTPASTLHDVAACHDVVTAALEIGSSSLPSLHLSTIASALPACAGPAKACTPAPSHPTRLRQASWRAWRHSPSRSSASPSFSSALLL